MRIVDEDNDEALNGITLYLTIPEASELKDSIEAIIADPIERHEHVPNKDGGKEITIAIYDEGGLDQCDDRSRKLIDVMANYDTGSLLYYEGRTAMKEGELQKAVSKFKQSAKLAPHFKTLECLGECLLSQGLHSEAIVYLAAAVGLGNKQFRARFLLAKAHLGIGEKSQAIEKLEEALILNSNYKAARELLDALLSE